jgi:hypothetical protein
MIKNMLTAKIKQKAGPNKIGGQDSFFVYVGANIPKGGKINKLFQFRINNARNLLKK